MYFETSCLGTEKESGLVQAKISRDHFTTEAEAVAEIEAAGFFPMTIESRVKRG